MNPNLGYYTSLSQRIPQLSGPAGTGKANTFIKCIAAKKSTFHIMAVQRSHPNVERRNINSVEEIIEIMLLRTPTS